MILTKIFYSLKRRIHDQRQLVGVKSKGENNHVFGEMTIVNPKNLTIGNNCSFNQGAYINAFNPVKIGNDVTLSAYASVISTGIDYKAWAMGKKQHINDSVVEIGNHVWIGSHAMVLQGVRITGEYVVIAANSVVTHDIDENCCIYAGCPARKIKNF